MIKIITLTVLTVALTTTFLPAAEQAESPVAKMNWLRGPAKASLGKQAEFNVPIGFMFVGAKETRKLLEMMGNPTNGDELGFLTPTNFNWFVVFEFSDVGYVKDDDKDKLDANKMLASIQKGNESANKEREKMGVPPLHVTGWEQPPRYNETTHNLEWAIRGESEGHPVVNWNTRLLGRHGVMEVSLVVNPDKLAITKPQYEKILADYSYKQGESYAEYKSGDKVAQYGLAALVLGGAAVGAAKLGLFTTIAVFAKKLWKVLIVAAVAVIGFFKKLIFGAGRRNPPE